MRKVVLPFLVFLSVIVLVLRFGGLLIDTLTGQIDRSGIRIEANTQAQVSIDNKNAGVTPLEKENLKSGEHLVSLTTDDSTWQGYVKLNSGTLTVINRDLAPTTASSSGEIITLGSGNGATVVSSPTSSDVEVDGQVAGKTPLTLSSLGVGEHTFAISHPNYLKRTIKATITQGYNLTLSVDLAVSDVDLTQQSNTPPIQSTPQVVVTQTPTGFLRVRASPSTDSQEVAQVTSGETLNLLEEQPNWDRVSTPDGKEGYVSTQYIQKK